MSAIRRDVLKFAGGAAAGIVVTPLPWRLLGDSAIWSQNWSWMPRVPRGEVTEKETRCTLCSANCKVRAKCVEGVPTGMWPAGDAMCPAGFVSHHVAYHPLRLREVLRNGQPAKIEDALQAARAASSGSVAVLDLFPGRTASLLHRKHLATIPNGVYLRPARIEGATSAAMAGLSGTAGDAVLDVDRLQVLLSAGTPVSDGWGAPKRVLPALRKFKLVQAEAFRSRSAETADEWLRIQAGGEAALLLGCAREIVAAGAENPRAKAAQGYAEFRKAILSASPERLSERSGVDREHMRTLALLMAESKSAVVADGNPVQGPASQETLAAAAALNVLSGADGFVTLPAARMPGDWRGVEERFLDDAEDGSIGLLLIDEPVPGLGVPWSLIERKLRKDATVIALTWTAANYGRRAGWLIPVPVYLESPEDAPPAPDAVQGWAASEPFIGMPSWAMHATEFTGRLSGDETKFDERMKQRKAAEAAATADSRPLKPMRILPAGTTPEGVLEAALMPASEFTFVSTGWRQASTSPLLGKLWQEWDLRRRPNELAANPSTLHKLGLVDGGRAKIEGPHGACNMQPRAEERTAAGLVVLEGGPGLIQTHETDGSGKWTTQGVRVVPA
jgi:anaerobic selenocysteine-containing dehydrogenase